MKPLNTLLQKGHVIVAILNVLNILTFWLEKKKREDTAKHMTHAICAVYVSLHFILLNFKDGAAKLLKKLYFLYVMRKRRDSETICIKQKAQIVISYSE